MKKQINPVWLVKYFYFTRRQRSAISALNILALVLTIFHFFVLDAILFSDFQVDHTDQNKFANLTYVNLDKDSIDIYLRDQKRRRSLTLYTPFYFNPNTISYDSLLSLGLKPNAAKNLVNYRQKGGRINNAKKFKKIYGITDEDYKRLSPYIVFTRKREKKNSKIKPNLDKNITNDYKLFRFDPNTVDSVDLINLGFSKKAIKSLLNYRKKGGRFYSFADLKKIYYMDTLHLKEVAPYINIEKPLIVRNSSAHKTQPSYKIDINTANKKDWVQLSGIGDSYADRIVNYRDKLGGFISIVQISETYGLPDSIYQQINQYLFLDSPIFRKVDINNVNLKDLSEHPLISYKEAKRIIAFRNQHGSFRAMVDFQKMHVFTDSFFVKIAPYLSFK